VREKIEGESLRTEGTSVIPKREREKKCPSVSLL
jgi:hypothetical protein